MIINATSIVIIMVVLIGGGGGDTRELGRWAIIEASRGARFPHQSTLSTLSKTVYIFHSSLHFWHFLKQTQFSTAVYTSHTYYIIKKQTPLNNAFHFKCKGVHTIYLSGFTSRQIALEALCKEFHGKEFQGYHVNRRCAMFDGHKGRPRCSRKKCKL